MREKMGRALSSGNMEEYAKAAAYSRETAPDRPVHKLIESLLSTESGFTNFRGLINWGLILLLIFGGKMALNNFNSNGIIMDPFVWRYIVQGEHVQPKGFLFLVTVNVFIMFGFVIEIFANRWLVPQPLILFFVIVNLLGSIVYPTVVILANDWSPFFTASVLMMYVVVFLKLWSYAMVNYWCRTAQREMEADLAKRSQMDPAMLHELLKEPQVKRKKVHHRRNGPNKPSDIEIARNRQFSSVKPPTIDAATLYKLAHTDDAVDLDEVNDRKIRIDATSYPDNLTVPDLYFFMFAPTLCYEINFPRTFCIRKRFLFKRLLELVCLSQLILCLVQQWMVPALKSSVTPFIRSRWIYTVERLLNIAIPNHILWLIGFYTIFHAFLNVVAELLRFGDRCFYEDWWNSTSVTSFWSAWNIPVHRWCHRHLYKPLLSRGCSRLSAAAVVFFLSAFFHELLVSVPLKMPRLWAFLGMLGQQPYAYLVYKFCKDGGKMGNVAMWLTLIVGQPLALYMYFHDYYVLAYN